MAQHTAPKVLLFDVFGTCVDWRTSITRAGEALGERLGIVDVDWAALADAWRERYHPAMEPIRRGERPWTTLDVLHREALDDVLHQFGLNDVPAAERDAFTLAWHRLDPWPDVVEGLTRLKTRFVIAPNSNGNIALLLDMAKDAGLPWDTILGAEIAHAYKPQPEVYRMSAAAAGAAPSETMMVAAHNDDLMAAAACGLMTAFVPRPLECGPGQTSDLLPEHAFDLVASDFRDLAAQFGA